MENVTTTSARGLLTTKQAAEFLGIGPETLDNWRCTKRNFIPYIKLGGRFVRYRQEDLDNFVRANAVEA